MKKPTNIEEAQKKLDNLKNAMEQYACINGMEDVLKDVELSLKVMKKDSELPRFGPSKKDDPEMWKKFNA